ncbi:MAG: TlpA family protein disulfide reductase [Flavobacteriales bacterium]
MSFPIPVSKGAENIIRVYTDSVFVSNQYAFRFHGNEYLNSYQQLIDFVNRMQNVTGVDTLLDLTVDEKMKEKYIEVFTKSFDALKNFGRRSKSSQMFYLNLLSVKMNGAPYPHEVIKMKYKEFIDSICRSDKIESNPILMSLCSSGNPIESINHDEIQTSEGDIEDFYLKPKITHIHSSFIDNKVVVLDFWATWCKPCIKQMPKLDSILSHYSSDDVACVAISIDQTFEKFSKFMNDNNQQDYTTAKYKNLIFFFDDGQMKIRYGIKIIPANFVYNKEGKLVAKNLNEDELKKVLDSLVFKN